jgi:hypothetical protein
MVDKLNRINVNIGSVNNDLQQQSKNNQEAEKKEVQEKEQVKPEYKQVDPDRLMDAMKRHGVHNFNHVMASGKVGSKSISDAVNYFTNSISPKQHTELTDKVKAVCKQEFPRSELDPDIIAEVVDNIIFETLTA